MQFLYSEMKVGEAPRDGYHRIVTAGIATVPRRRSQAARDRTSDLWALSLQRPRLVGIDARDPGADHQLDLVKQHQRHPSLSF